MFTLLKSLITTTSPQVDMTDDLVRMFSIEYGREYRRAVQSGVKINRQFVENYLNN